MAAARRRSRKRSTAARNNVMPSFKNILTGPEIHLVAAYVWSLSNSGKSSGAAPAAIPAK